MLMLALCISCVEAEENLHRVKVEKLLNHAPLRAEQNVMVYFAKELQGTPYGAGTLDRNHEERLVTRLDSVDCVTFVENVLALALCDQKNIRSFSDFEQQLQQIRYRDGQIDGFSSRLNYFTEWIENNTKKRLVSEKTLNTEGTEVRIFNLNFMSEHRSAYPALEDEVQLSEIRDVEVLKENYHMPYIPKELLNGTAEKLEVKDGDILALTTSIDGLDVVHTGIACWMDGELHMIHASSVKGRVIVDETSLYDYLKHKKRNTGIRVVRMR